MNPPAALGSGHRTLASKVAAEVFKMALQEPFGKPLRRHADTFVSFTSDMGVELGIPDFAVSGQSDCIEQLLPSWFHRELLRGNDIGDVAEDPGAPVEAPQAQV